ncbi:DUF1028 domain-containing protein [Blastococcus sp. MG754426]|uniref:DUF1028 domain-containing protein n=1 Tax=unclassified Blastococcus TaxID=2619396 RepID=UPI001EEFFE09|nr:MULTISPECIES: DUF1028 domain-containing protein [unclassified Blastococcus]MCF6509413.1 DUF1028 domain-containing protein [Blastococcus sp. MG754426]MCF6513906.1 DUF1028 domain-containing protein [Blastococcus sp. MG754427]MCF6736806.1 DUF1028 domain-containing protein [Blastococcus sp. KM273129]
MTFSVLARDPRTGDLGIAVASCILAVGRVVPAARPGVGVVAVQARSPRGLRGVLLEGLAAGTAPADLVRRAAHAAEDADRQIAVLDVAGGVAADTAPGSFPVSGHRVGPGFSVQGNMLASDAVLPAMAEGFAGSDGALADRLLAALAAGEAAGGDLRGRQSAALLVVGGTPVSPEDDGVRTDLRVDDSGDPVAQLRVLRNLQRAYDERDYETLAVFAPEGARDLYAALAASQRGDRAGLRRALTAMRERPGWAAWLAGMAGDPRVAALSRVLAGPFPEGDHRGRQAGVRADDVAGEHGGDGG